MRTAATTVIVIGGAQPPATLAAVVPPSARVIAADSGYDHAVALGLPVDLVVGDLDSISPTGLAHATAAAVPVERHPADKDATDTELALDRAVADGAERVIVLSGGGDRIDHLLATLFLVASRRYRAVGVELWWGDTRIAVVHGGDEQPVVAGLDSLFSVLPVHGPVGALDIDGAEYPLVSADVAAGSTLGVSNRSAGAAVVRVGTGTVLVISPGPPEVLP